jgi:hypothetical protein
METVEELREKLRALEAQKKIEEEEEAIRKMEEVWNRCKDATYISNGSEYPFYVTYRKVSNLAKNKTNDGYLTADIHEEVLISFRQDQGDERDINPTREYVSCEIESYKNKGRRRVYIQEDYPITESEYNEAKNFATQQIENHEKFFEKFTSLPSA